MNEEKQTEQGVNTNSEFEARKRLQDLMSTSTSTPFKTYDKAKFETTLRDATLSNLQKMCLDAGITYVGDRKELRRRLMAAFENSVKEHRGRMPSRFIGNQEAGANKELKQTINDILNK